MPRFHRKLELPRELFICISKINMISETNWPLPKRRIYFSLHIWLFVRIFKNAVSALELHIKEQQINDHSFTITFTEEIIFIADHIINVLNTNQTLLTFISKNLSWGIFKEALTTNVADDDINFKDIYYEMLEDSGLNLNEPEIMLFMIVELISSTCYSSILYKEPADIDRLKPYLYKAIKAIINEHTIED